MTYSSFVAQSRGGSRSQNATRLEQLRKWCGPHFDGCLLFDECHRAKHFHVDCERQTKTARAVHEIQHACPLARVVYCSATGITVPKNMGYLMRLVLWGPGTPFVDFTDFFTTISHPLGARELVVRLPIPFLLLSPDCSLHLTTTPGYRLEEAGDVSEPLLVFCWSRIRDD